MASNDGDAFAPPEKILLRSYRIIPLDIGIGYVWAKLKNVSYACLSVYDPPDATVLPVSGFTSELPIATDTGLLALLTRRVFQILAQFEFTASSEASLLACINAALACKGASRANPLSSMAFGRAMN